MADILRAAQIALGHRILWQVCLHLSPRRFVVWYHSTSVAPSPKPEGLDGYSKTIVAPPSGVIVARWTTLNCGKWHTVLQGDTCATIALQNRIEASLFREVNPSLAAGTGCDTSLEQQTALCVGPTYTWRTDEEASQRL